MRPGAGAEADVGEVVIEGGRVWDGTGSAPRVTDLLIRDGSIVDMTQGCANTVTVDAERIDESGLFVMPGMIDCHGHLTSSGAANYELQRLKDLLPLQALRGAASAQKMPIAGFTTARDLSAPGLSTVA